MDETRVAEQVSIMDLDPDLTVERISVAGGTAARSVQVIFAGLRPPGARLLGSQWTGGGELQEGCRGRRCGNANQRKGSELAWFWQARQQPRSVLVRGSVGEVWQLRPEE